MQRLQANDDYFWYTSSVAVLGVGLCFASVPLYRLFCSKTGYAGTPIIYKDKLLPDNMKPLTEARKIKVRFIASKSDALNWSFIPQQTYINVFPGETALAFFKAKNLSNTEISGLSTYNVLPDQVGPYFNKIQCFCFEEQKLEPGEEVDMPVFFFIDPEFHSDPLMKDINSVTLSYTFFKAN